MPISCPQCPAPATLIGSVFCESGNYDGSRYAAEGNAAVYQCSGPTQHIFAIDVPFAESGANDAEGDDPDGEGITAENAGCRDCKRIDAPLYWLPCPERHGLPASETSQGDRP
jgi:hypothetical protein